MSHDAELRERIVRLEMQIKQLQEELEERVVKDALNHSMYFLLTLGLSVAFTSIVGWFAYSGLNDNVQQLILQGLLHGWDLKP